VKPAKKSRRMPKGFRCTFAVPPGYKFLIAELHYGNDHWAELNTERGRLELIVFPSHLSRQQLAVPFEEALKALQQAERELRSRSVFFERENAE
jgi:hypothetical protein